jgi:hypothetical protein
MKAHHEIVVIVLIVPIDITLIELHNPSILRVDRVWSARPIVVVVAQARVCF